MAEKQDREKDGTLRIGAATSDGIVVNQHFGHASKFRILEVKDGTIDWLSEPENKRELESVCDGGTHDGSKLLENAEALSDCDCLLVSRIGPGARNVLENQGIRVFELPGLISESVEQMLGFLEIEKLLDGEGTEE